MSRPKLEVNQVWILEDVMPYEGSEILGVFVDPEVAMKDRDDRGRWKKITADGETIWRTGEGINDYHSFYLLTKHNVRTK